ALRRGRPSHAGAWARADGEDFPLAARSVRPDGGDLVQAQRVRQERPNRRVCGRRRRSALRAIDRSACGCFVMLTRYELDIDEARKYYSDIVYHAVDVSILLSATGYKDTFRERLFGHPGIAHIRVHLLTLRDMFEESPIFVEAVKDLPP